MKKFWITFTCLLFVLCISLGVAQIVKDDKLSPGSSANLSVDMDSDVSLSEIAVLNKKIDEYAKEVASLNAYIEELKAENSDNEVIIDGLEEVIKNKTSLIEELQTQVAELQLAYDKLQEEYNSLQESYSSAQIELESLLGLYDGSVKELVVPEGVTAIRKYAFAGLSLDSIVLPSTITNIGENAFNGGNYSSIVINSPGDLVFENYAFNTATIDELSISCNSLTCNNLVYYSTVNSMNIDCNSLTVSNAVLGSNCKVLDCVINADKIVDRGTIMISLSDPGVDFNVALNCDEYEKDYGQQYGALFNYEGGSNYLNFDLHINNKITQKKTNLYTLISRGWRCTNLKLTLGDNFTSSVSSSYFKGFRIGLDTALSTLELNSTKLFDYTILFEKLTDADDLLLNVKYTGSDFTNLFGSYMKYIGNLYVDDSLYDQYINDSNYANYSNKIHKMSEFPLEA